MISIADTYDVMTARDSYRKPVSSRRGDRRAAARRRARSSTAQLVEVFVGLLEQRVLMFRHADDADFERELDFERRVRDYAEPRVAAA